jgi:hypothetical protein
MAPVVIKIGRHHGALASGPHLVGELHNQNAVLGDQAHQGDQANLAEHIERPARPFEGQQRPHHGQGDREQDHKRVYKALKLRRQDQKDEQQSQHEHQRQ